VTEAANSDAPTGPPGDGRKPLHSSLPALQFAIDALDSVVRVELL
jgi:hypothetical protein